MNETDKQIRGNVSQTPHGWITFDEVMAGLPPKTQAEINAGSKKMCQAFIDARRAAGALRYLTAFEDGAHIAHCLDVEVASEGDTQEEAIANLREALEFYFDNHPEIKVTFVDDPDWTEEWIKTKTDVGGGQIEMTRFKWET